jgi:hypothetical protein
MVLNSKVVCLVPENDSQTKYIKIEGEENQYESLDVRDHEKIFYEDPGSLVLRNPVAIKNRHTELMGRQMYTKGKDSRIEFLNSGNPMINKIKLNVKGGIEGASIVCEDAKHGLVTKQRDFSEGEIVTIPWSCGLVSTTVSISRIDTTIMDNGDIKEDAELDDVVAIMTFEDGKSILDVPKIYKAVKDSLEVAVMELPAKYGWGIGGGLLALLIAIGALILCICCYKWESKCCLPMLRLLTEIKNKSKKETMKEKRRLDMDEWWTIRNQQFQLTNLQSGDTTMDFDTMESAPTSIYPSIVTSSPAIGMVKTGG